MTNAAVDLFRRFGPCDPGWIETKIAADWSEHLRVAEAPADLLSGIDAGAFPILVASLEGKSVSTAMAFDHGTDCGI